jgi:hypothetical protein
VQGTLTFIAMADILPGLLPRLVQQKASALAILRPLFFFLLGIVVLGLTRLHDVHCEASGGEHHDH